MKLLAGGGEGSQQYLQPLLQPAPVTGGPVEVKGLVPPRPSCAVWLPPLLDVVKALHGLGEG
jgi:hypothetical protein